MMMIKIGVFDSGVGGESVVNAIKKSISDIEVIYATDRANVPYGGKSPERLLALVIPILQKLQADGCAVIVIACNTVTTTIIEEVRQALSVPVVAVEPMVKPACAMSKSKKITVCATPATLTSKRYKQLLDTYADGVEVFEPNCSDWAYLIENNQRNFANLESDIVYSLRKGSDVIVLACTHYHWIENEIKKIAVGYSALVIQPEEAIVRRLSAVLELTSR